MYIGVSTFGSAINCVPRPMPLNNNGSPLDQSVGFVHSPAFYYIALCLDFIKADVKARRMPIELARWLADATFWMDEFGNKLRGPKVSGVVWWYCDSRIEELGVVIRVMTRD